MRPGSDPARARLDAKLLEWMREPASPECWPQDEARFDGLALELFAFQFERIAAYRSFCEGRGRTPRTVTTWREIPAVPTAVLKELSLRSFDAGRIAHVFRTSGTSAAVRGALELDTLELYEASLEPTFRVHVLADLAPGERIEMRILAPSAAAVPDSSLSHMFATLLPRFGTRESGFDLAPDTVDPEALVASLRGAAERGRRVAVCGTAFAFVHLVDSLAARGERIVLAEGSRVMETGGFKGRSREVGRGELHAAIEHCLGVPVSRIVNQYGMTELASQFYDTPLRFPEGPRRKLGPPWARVRVVDPVTGDDTREGEHGMIVVVDLANAGGVCALLPADVGRRVGDGFEVLGRAEGAEARGCSIAADEILGGGA